MTNEERRLFLKEAESDANKKEQLAFTRNVKDALGRHESKRRATEEMERRYENENFYVVPAAAMVGRPEDFHIEEAARIVSETSKPRRRWPWVAAIIAALVAAALIVALLLAL